MRKFNSKCQICDKGLYRRPYELKKYKYICCISCRSILYKEYPVLSKNNLRFGHGWNKGLSKKNGDVLKYGRKRSRATRELISKSLKGKLRVSRIAVVCKSCKKEIKVLPSAYKKGRQFCSVKCLTQCINAKKKLLIGDKSPNWKGGISKIEKQCETCKKKFYGKPKQTSCSIKCKNVRHSKFMVENKIAIRVKGTDIENIVKKWLEENNINFEEQKSVESITIVDFFIYPNICLYADGDYWHNLEKVKNRDKWINAQLERKGYVVIRLTGSEIKRGEFKNADFIFRQK